MNQQFYQVGPSPYQPAMPQPSIPATNTVPIIIPANQPVQPITCEAQIPIMPTNYVSVAQGDVNEQAENYLPEAPLDDLPFFNSGTKETYD